MSFSRANGLHVRRNPAFGSSFQSMSWRGCARISCRPAIGRTRNIVAAKNPVHAMFMASENTFNVAFSAVRPPETPRGGGSPIFMACCGARTWAICISRRLRQPFGRSQARTTKRRREMSMKAGWLGTGLTLAVLTTAASVSLGASPALAAVVYCKTAGVPQGCVVRTGVPAAVVVTPRVRVATVGVGARGVGVRPGTAWNRGGPVNRVGRR
jgi:hypothetical protein